MRNRHLLVALVLAIVATAGVIVHQLGSNKPEIEQAAFSYVQQDNWAIFPTSPPAPVWETGWQTDVFLFLHDNEISGTSEQQLASKRMNASEISAAYELALSAYGVVYAPLLRATHPVDASDALASYLKYHNNGRAFIVVYDEPQRYDLDAIIRSERASNRFGGYYYTSKEITSAAEVATRTLCPDHMHDDCIDTIILSITKDGVVRLGEAIDSANGLYSKFQSYLKDELQPMAEPLDDLEEIEVIETKKPSESFRPSP